jgi:hypothetical protein
LKRHPHTVENLPNDVSLHSVRARAL